MIMFTHLQKRSKKETKASNFKFSRLGFIADKGGTNGHRNCCMFPH